MLGMEYLLLHAQYVSVFVWRCTDNQVVNVVYIALSWGIT